MFYNVHMQSMNLNINLYFFDGNQGSYSPLNMSNRVTRNTDSNYVPMEERKSGSLTICSRIWLGNIFPIECYQSSGNKNFGKKYVGA